MSFLADSLKENAEILDKLGTSHLLQNRGVNHGRSNGDSSGVIFCSYCCKPGQDKRNCFKLKRKDSRPNHAGKNNGNIDRQNFDSQDVVFTDAASNDELDEDIWVCDRGASAY